MALKDNLFSEEDFQRIENSIQNTSDAEEIIQLAKQAGFDVAEQEKRNKEARDKLLRIKNTFFPGR